MNTTRESKKESSRATTVLKVIGDSMTSESGRSYPDGTIIFTDASRKPKEGDGVIAMVSSTGASVFRLLIYVAGRAFLKPLNSAYQSIPLDNKCNIVGVVSGVFVAVE